MKAILVMLCTLGVMMSFSVKADIPPIQMKAKPAPVANVNKSKTTNAGLRSDGELVQGKTPKNRLKQSSGRNHQQQGRVLTDSDLNEAE